MQLDENVLIYNGLRIEQVLASSDQSRQIGGSRSQA
jgi:hypothetical protein